MYDWVDAMLSGMVAAGVYRNQYTQNRLHEPCSPSVIFLLVVGFALFLFFLFILNIDIDYI